MALDYYLWPKEISDSGQSLEVCHTSFNQMPGKQLKKLCEPDFRLLTDPDLSGKALPARRQGSIIQGLFSEEGQLGRQARIHGFLEAGHGHSSLQMPWRGVRPLPPASPSALS